MTSPAPRPEVAALPAYVPGARGGDGPAPIKLSSNESPYGPLPSVLSALADGGSAPNRYPDMGATALHARLAEVAGVAPDTVVAVTLLPDLSPLEPLERAFHLRQRDGELRPKRREIGHRVVLCRQVFWVEGCFHE